MGIDETLFSTTPIEGAEEAFEQWTEPPEFAPPPQPGIHYFKLVSKTADEAKIQGDGGIEYKVLKTSLNLQVVGGNDDGLNVNFVRLSNKMFQRRDGTRSSQLLDLLKSANVTGVVRNNAEYNKALDNLIDTGALFKGQVDWRAFCKQCYEEALLAQTGASDIETAKQMATRDMFNTAGDAATKARNARGFQQGPDGKYIPTLTCEKHGVALGALPQIKRFLAPSSDVPF